MFVEHSDDIHWPMTSDVFLTVRWIVGFGGEDDHTGEVPLSSHHAIVAVTLDHLVVRFPCYKANSFLPSSGTILFQRF